MIKWELRRILFGPRDFVRVSADGRERGGLWLTPAEYADLAARLAPVPPLVSLVGLVPPVGSLVGLVPQPWGSTPLPDAPDPVDAHAATPPASWVAPDPSQRDVEP